MLNGFPGVNHGVEGCRKVYDAVNVPLQARHGTPDARLLAEVIHAAGWTSNEGGGISYNVPYAKSVSLEDTIKYWQYCDRLVGWYEDRGVTLNREPFGPLTGTLVPPSISNTIGIIEALLAAEQGVKNITVGYGMGGNMIQDIAAVRSLQEQTDSLRIRTAPSLSRQGSITPAFARQGAKGTSSTPASTPRQTPTAMSPFPSSKHLSTIARVS